MSATILTTRERSKYSLARAICGSHVRNAGSGEGLEADASRATRELFGPDLQFRADGVIVPPEILMGDHSERVFNFGAQQRALGATTFAAAGALVGEEQEPVFLRYLFPQSIVFGLGANFLGGLKVPKTSGTGQVAVPRIVGANEGSWLAEGDGAATTADMTAALTVASPRRVVTTQIVSKQLLSQTSPQGEATLWRVLMAGVAAAIDRAALAGTGGVQPLGLLTIPGVTEVSLGSNGGAPTLAALNTVEAGPLSKNVPLFAGGYAVSVNARTKLKNTAKAASTSTFLLETVNGRDFVNGFRGFGTPLLPDTLTKGIGASLGALVFGAEWANLHVCQWAGMEIVNDPFTYAATNRALLTVTVFLDVITPAPQAFSRCVDVVTT